MPLLLIFVAQLIYSTSDLFQKMIFNKVGFGLHLLKNVPFLAAMLLAISGFVLQRLALSRYDLSRTIVLFGVFAVIFSVLFGVIFLRERMTIINYLGVVFAILAIVLVQIK